MAKKRKRKVRTVHRLTRDEFNDNVRRMLSKEFPGRGNELMSEYASKIHASYAVRVPESSVVRDIKKYERGE